MCQEGDGADGAHRTVGTPAQVRDLHRVGHAEHVRGVGIHRAVRRGSAPWEGRGAACLGTVVRLRQRGRGDAAHGHREGEELHGARGTGARAEDAAMAGPGHVAAVARGAAADAAAQHEVDDQRSCRWVELERSLEFELHVVARGSSRSGWRTRERGNPVEDHGAIRTMVEVIGRVQARREVLGARREVDAEVVGPAGECRTVLGAPGETGDLPPATGPEHRPVVRVEGARRRGQAPRVRAAAVALGEGQGVRHGVAREDQLHREPEVLARRGRRRGIGIGAVERASEVATDAQRAVGRDACPTDDAEVAEVEDERTAAGIPGKRFLEGHLQDERARRGAAEHRRVDGQRAVEGSRAVGAVVAVEVGADCRRGDRTVDTSTVRL